MLKNISRLLASTALVAALLVSHRAHAVSDLQDYSTTANTNTDIGGVSVAEGSPFANMNNALRELMAELKRGVAGQGSDIASATTTAICAAGTSAYAKVTGTTTITGLGTAAAGCWRIITFTGALTLTHNATSLIIPGAANITTVAGDVAGFVSEASGNWRMIWFSRVPITVPLILTSTAAGTLLTVTSTDAGAGQGPNFSINRDSATPATNDVIGSVQFNGRDSGGNATTYGELVAQIADVTNGSEDVNVFFNTIVAGAANSWTLQSGGWTSNGQTFKGSNTLNAAGLYVAGHGTVAQVVSDTELTYVTLGTILPFDNSIPQSGEGDATGLSVSITPTNASSIIRIRVTLMLGSAGTVQCSGAIFVDAAAGAVAAGTTGLTIGIVSNMNIEYEESAASTSARTYSVRAGSSAAADCFLNGDNASRIFGGVAVSKIVVEEVLPQ